MDGHHVIWKGTPPSADRMVRLSEDAGMFSFSKTFGLSIELNCTAGEPCVEDGDIIHTLVTAVSASESSPDMLVAEVTIITVVESLASCNNSVAVIMQSGGSLGSERGVPIKDLLLTDAALVFSIFALSMSMRSPSG